LRDYATHDEKSRQDILHGCDQAYLNWKQTSQSYRCYLMKQLAGSIELEKEKLAHLITIEMGKPIRESISEIEKCVFLCEYYSQPEHIGLTPESLIVDGNNAMITFEPTGIIFAIMPWNFPFWQVFRFAIPNLIAGNVCLLKHAPNVTGCALAIEELFSAAGFPTDVFRTLIIDTVDVESIISNRKVKGVTLTGSAKAGSSVAALAGKYVKKSVLELGGSDPFLVFPDANLHQSCLTGARSRMINAGQVCIASKRFIVHESVFDKFVEMHHQALRQLVLGDPMEYSTDIGPLARPDLTDQIEEQVKISLELGAVALCGAKRSNLHREIYEPTLLINIQKGMPVYDQETFGPVSVVIPFKDKVEAIELANDTHFGLGASIWSENIELANEVATKIDAGAVFINGMTRSDPRLPFGGTKGSGYGRELHSIGIKEFMNIKTIWTAS